MEERSEHDHRRYGRMAYQLAKKKSCITNKDCMDCNLWKTETKIGLRIYLDTQKIQVNRKNHNYY